METIEQLIEENKYSEAVKKFLSATNSTLEIQFSHKGKHFYNDKEERNIYNFKLTKGKYVSTAKVYASTFGDSIHNTKNHKKPTKYDILSCLNFHEIGGFTDFCDEFGYDKYDFENEETMFVNLVSQEIYFSVLREQEGLKRLYNSEELEQLNEIR